MDGKLKDEATRNSEEKLKDGNTCIGLGVGVGALGAGTGLLIGATCPLCYFVAPALVGMGIVERRKAKKQLETSKENERKEEDSN